MYLVFKCIYVITNYIFCPLSSLYPQRRLCIDLVHTLVGRRSNYPRVKKAFIKFNTSLCSSAPVERLFSFAGFLHSPTRGLLSDKMFETLVFLKRRITKIIINKQCILCILYTYTKSLYNICCLLFYNYFYFIKYIVYELK